MGRPSSVSDALIHIAYILQHPSPTVPIVHLILINLSPGVYIPFFLTLSLNLPDPLSEPRGDFRLYNLWLYTIIPDPLFPLLLLALFDMVVWDDVAIKISHRYRTMGTLCIDSVK